MKLWRAAFAVCFCSASMVAAQEEPGVFVSYSLEMQGSVVKGSMMIATLVDGRAVPQGYSLKRVIEFITDDCASGKVRKVKLGKKRTFERRGFIDQRFRMSCLGGPHRRIGATYAKVKIERQEDGRDLAEYEFTKDGYLTTMQRYR